MPHLKDSFGRCGLRCTKQREGIYRALVESRSHPTAEELFWLAKQSDHDLSLATVYNALDAFCERGLCRRLATNSGPTRFDADTSEHLHVQDHTGAIHDVPEHLSKRFYDALGPELLHDIAAALGLPIAGARIELAAAPPQPDAPDP